jgi:hypothetical protein
MGDRETVQRQAHGFGLRLCQRAAHPVHGDATEGGIDGRYKANYLHVVPLAQDVERPR